MSFFDNHQVKPSQSDFSINTWIEHEKREKKKQASVKEITKKFAETTTAHGYYQIAHSKNYFVILFWFAILIACHILLYFQISPLIKQYIAKPISTKIYLNNRGKQDFPVVVVCNENMIRKDKYEELILEIQQFYKGSNISVANDTTLQEYISDYADGDVDIFEYGHTHDELIQVCTWRGYECNGTNWDKMWHWKYGACFAYNPGIFNNGSSRNPIQVSKTGPGNGLELTLFINQKQYITRRTETAGVRIYIGNQGKLYEPYNEGFSLSPGFAYSIGIRKRTIKRADPFKNNTCIKDTSLSLKYSVGQKHFTKYSRGLCQALCIAELQLKSCNCTQFYLPSLKNNTQVCYGDQSTCAYRIEERYASEYISCAPCSPPCDETIFETDVSFSQFPTLFPVTPEKENEWKENLKVSVYFKTLDEEVWEDQTYYQIQNLLADIGGQLGLLSGWSALTTFEFISLFVTMVGCCLKKVLYKNMFA